MTSIKIKDIPKEERPVERLITKGAGALSNEELLSILLKTGTKNDSVKILSASILKQIQKIQNLKEITLEQLLKIHGVGQVKAATILAASELAKRMNCEIDSLKDTKFIHTQTVYKYYKSKLSGVMQEQFYALYLDSQKKIIKDKLLFMGTLNYSMVHPREIFKEALLVNAACIICVHNHPSGNFTPSPEDFKITDKLKELGFLLNIPILDHIIIGDGYYSFFENGNI